MFTTGSEQIMATATYSSLLINDKKSQTQCHPSKTTNQLRFNCNANVNSHL